MQTATRHAFAQKLAELEDLLERTQAARTEAHAKVSKPAPRFQASNKGGNWDVIKIDTGEAQGFTFTYQAAMRFVDAMEAGAASKSGALA